MGYEPFVPTVSQPSSGLGPFRILSPGELAMAAGWEPSQGPTPPWPDPPPVTVDLQERLYIDGNTWPATSSQVLDDCLDMGGMYSGGLSQVVFYQDIRPGVPESYTLSLQTAPVLEESAFIDVLNIAIVDNGNTVDAGDVLSVWFGSFDEANSDPLARYLRWKLVIAGGGTQPFFFAVRCFLKNKK